MLAGSLFVAAGESGFYVPTATCPYILGKRVVYERPLDMRRRFQVKHFVLNDGTALASRKATTAVWYDDDALYVSPRWTTRMGALDPGEKTADGRLKRDLERIRIFLQPDRGSADVYEISVSAGCRISEARWTGEQADESWTAGVAARNLEWEDLRYSNEVVIPFEALGGKPEPDACWGFNIVSEEAATGERSNWAGVRTSDDVGGEGNLVRELGVIRFADPDETTTVGIWLLPEPMTPGARMRVSYRFGSPEGSAVSHMVASDGGKAFEPSDAQVLAAGPPVPSWRPHSWVLPKGMPLRVQFVLTRGDEVYYATAAFPVPEERADARAERLCETYADMVDRASGIANDKAERAFLDVVEPLQREAAVIREGLAKSLRRKSSRKRSWEIDEAATRLEPIARRSHLLEGTLGAFETLDAAASVPGFGVGHTHSLVKLRRFQSDVDYGTPLRIELARGERESAQLVVVPFDKPLKGVTATWTDLAGPDGAKLSADDIRIDVVGYVETQPGGYPAPWVGWWPDPLMPLEPTDVAADQIQPLWVTVYAPPGTPAGTYRGTITVASKNAGSADVPLEVEVWDYDLPLRGTFKTAIAIWPLRDIAKWYGFEVPPNRFDSPQTIPREFRLRMYDFLLSHRVNPSTLWQRHTMPDKEDVEYCVERGMNALAILVPIMEVNDEVIAHVAGWRDFLKEEGWLDLGYIFGYDEIEDRPQHIPTMLVERPKLKQAFPEIPLACTLRHPHREWDSFVDIWIPTTYVYDPEEWAEHLKTSPNDEVWSYTTCEIPPFAGVLMDVPALKHRVLFWQHFQYRIPGYLYYLATGWAPNQRKAGEPRWPDVPWVSSGVDGAHNGCGQLVYPGKDGLLSSIRFEVIRDGIEDYEAFVVLDELTAKLEESGKDPGLVASNREMLKVSPEVTRNLREYTDDPLVLLAHRRLLSERIVRTRRRLGQ